MAKTSRLRKKGQRPTIFLTKNRTGLSTIVTTLILIALSLAAVVLVWTFVNSMIKKQIGSSQACYGNFDKITINKQYTCYEQISSNNFKLRFSLGIGDVSIDKVIVSVSSSGATKSYTITNTAQNLSGISMYSGINAISVILPTQNAGLTYNTTGFTSKIDSITIAPVIGGNLCNPSDSFSDIQNCVLLS